MLTPKQVEKIAEESWDIVFKKGRHPNGYAGWCLLDIEEIRIYLPQIYNCDSLAKTLIHELIHARDDIRNKPERDYWEDFLIESEAIDTYKKNPKIIEYFGTARKIPSSLSLH